MTTIDLHLRGRLLASPTEPAYKMMLIWMSSGSICEDVRRRFFFIFYVFMRVNSLCLRMDQTLKTTVTAAASLSGLALLALTIGLPIMLNQMSMLETEMAAERQVYIDMVISEFRRV